MPGKRWPLSGSVKGHWRHPVQDESASAPPVELPSAVDSAGSLIDGTP